MYVQSNAIGSISIIDARVNALIEHPGWQAFKLGFLSGPTYEREVKKFAQWHCQKLITDDVSSTVPENISSSVFANAVTNNVIATPTISNNSLSTIQLPAATVHHGNVFHVTIHENNSGITFGNDTSSNASNNANWHAAVQSPEAIFHHWRDQNFPVSSNRRIASNSSVSATNSLVTEAPITTEFVEFTQNVDPNVVNFGGSQQLFSLEEWLP